MSIYINENDKWCVQLQKLREIILECGLTEDFKWRNPCYTLNGKNVILLARTNDYCALSFFKGALLKDELSILTQQTENMQAERQMRFVTLREIIDSQEIIENYIREAIAIENKGLKVEYKKTEDFDLPAELQEKLAEDSAFNTAFYALTPGRQRGYILHFSSAKQPKTRIARIEKYVARILDGKGINDCTCGHSKKMPNCDGSHKFF